jgi:hypothetical protein
MLPYRVAREKNTLMGPVGPGIKDDHWRRAAKFTRDRSLHAASLIIGLNHHLKNDRH